MSQDRRWTDPVSFIEKTPWIDLCSSYIIADQVATREELEHAVRMSFAENLDPFSSSASSTTKSNYATKLKICRAFAASLNLSENIPRISPIVFEGLEAAIEDATVVENNMIQQVKKKHASSLVNPRQQWVSVCRLPISTLVLMTWMRISKTITVEEEEAGGNNNNISSASNHSKTTSWPPVSTRAARRFLARMVPLAFISTFVFQSTSTTIPGLLSTISSMGNDAASGFLSSVDPMSRCALICLGASTEGVETGIFGELQNAEVQGEKGFFRTPTSFRCSTSLNDNPQSCQQNDMFTIAHWFPTSDTSAPAPYSVSQLHHFYLVHALRRSLCRLEISDVAAQKWIQYCEMVVKDVERYASVVIGKSSQRTIHWMSNHTNKNKGVGVRFFNCLLRECSLLSEAVSVHMIRPESQLSTMLWMLVSHASQGLRAALNFKEYDPLLEVRDTDGSSSANTITLAPPQQQNQNQNQQRAKTVNPQNVPLRPFVCTPEQLFGLCRAALRCDVSMTKSEKRIKAADFMRDTCTEDLLVSVSLDPSQISLTLVAIFRFAAEFSVPLETHLHLIMSIVALSPVIGATVLNDHLRFIYKSLSSIGRVELLLRILFLPLTAAAFEVQMAFQEAPQEDLKDGAFCMFHLWRCLAPINATSRTQAMQLYHVFKACFNLAFDSDSDFKLMWECCMLDDLCLMGERERAASVCVKDTLLDGFFDCVAESKTSSKSTFSSSSSSSEKTEQKTNLKTKQVEEEEGILFATTFMFRFGVFPRMHCAAILKRLVLHVRVLLGSSSANVNNTNQQQQQQQNQNINNHSNENGENNKTNENDNDESFANSGSMASTLLQFLCGFGSSNAGVLHDDLDRYSDAFFDAVANVLVIAGKFAATQGERAASRVFHSLQDLAWDCLTSFKTARQLAAAQEKMMAMEEGAVGDTASSSEGTPSYMPSNTMLSKESQLSSSQAMNNNNNSLFAQQQHQQQMQFQNLLNSIMNVPRRGLPSSTMIATTSPATTAALILLQSQQLYNQQQSNSQNNSRISPPNTTRMNFSEFSTGGQSSSSTNTSSSTKQNNNNNNNRASSTSSQNNNNNTRTIRNFFFGNKNNNNTNENSSGRLAGGGGGLNQNLAAMIATTPFYDKDDDFFNYCLEDSNNIMDLQPTVNFVGLRIVGLRALPSVQERMLKRLEAIGVALTHVTAKHVSLRERAVIWLRACWKGAEAWLAHFHEKNSSASTSSTQGGGGGNGGRNNNSLLLASSQQQTSMMMNNINNNNVISGGSSASVYDQNASGSNTNAVIQQLFVNSIASEEQEDNYSDEEDDNNNKKRKKNKKKNKKSNSSENNNTNSLQLLQNANTILTLPEIENALRRKRNTTTNLLTHQQDQVIRERCEQLCITCSSLCNLLLHHNDVLLAAAGGTSV